MQKNINSLVKPVEKNGKLLTYRDTSKEGVIEYYCSTFIKKKNVLVKGDYWNKNSAKRNAKIVLFNGQTEEIIGESRLSRKSK